MITRRTKIQLVIFAIITLVGVSYVGARYAKLDRFFVDDSYTVVAHFSESGGAFAGGEVTYRGVGVGQVEKMVLTEDGVDMHLRINDDYDEIPAETRALVGNRSAVGEQYVELQPMTDSGPYLDDSSEIPDELTDVPIRTETLLTNIVKTVESVDEDDLRTVVSELGAAFGGTGEDLQTIIDSGNEFINAADANFEVTTKLIRDSNTVLTTQVASESAFRRFARDMELFSTAVADNDKDLRRLIDNGSSAATELRTFLEDNEVELGELINNLVTTGEVVVKRLDGVEQILVIYPYVVEGGFTVVSRSDATGGLYNAHFGAVDVLEPKVCTEGYESTNRRDPVSERGDAPMNFDARCTAPPSVTNARGAQNAPRAGFDFKPPAADQSVANPDIAYDPETGEVTWGKDRVERLLRPGRLAPSTLGEETWKWLYLQPLLAQD